MQEKEEVNRFSLSGHYSVSFRIPIFVFLSSFLSSKKDKKSVPFFFGVWVYDFDKENPAENFWGFE